LEALAVIWAPARSLREVAEGRKALLGFGVVALYAVLSLAATAIFVLGGGLRAQFEAQDVQLPSGAFDDILLAAQIGTLVFAALAPVVWWLAVSLLMQLVTHFFGGTGPLPAMLAVVGVALAPFVLLAVVQIPLGGLQIVLGPQSAEGTALALLANALSLAALVWHIVLVVIGASFARNVSYGQSAGSCAISCAGCLIIPLVLAVVVVMIAVLAGAGPQ
jgi:hypothetical protein